MSTDLRQRRRARIAASLAERSGVPVAPPTDEPRVERRTVSDEKPVEWNELLRIHRSPVDDRVWVGPPVGDDPDALPLAGNLRRLKTEYDKHVDIGFQWKESRWRHLPSGDGDCWIQEAR